LLQQNAAAVVLLDLQLPDADGLQMLEQIKRDYPETQVIILTAHDSLSNAIESIISSNFRAKVWRAFGLARAISAPRAGKGGHGGSAAHV
jgi:DNA-binding NarL/FixJ family response regulator